MVFIPQYSEVFHNQRKFIFLIYQLIKILLILNIYFLNNLEINPVFFVASCSGISNIFFSVNCASCSC